MSQKPMKRLYFLLCGALLVGCDAQNGPSGFDCPVPAGGGVHFVEPLDGSAVPGTFTVVMAAGELEVQPAGTLVAGTGHMHILVDVPFVEAGGVVPADDQHRHYGDGSLTTELELPAGEHVLRLQFADGAHRAYGAAGCQDEIRVSVAGTDRP